MTTIEVISTQKLCRSLHMVSHPSFHLVGTVTCLTMHLSAQSRVTGKFRRPDRLKYLQAYEVGLQKQLPSHSLAPN